MEEALALEDVLVVVLVDDVVVVADVALVDDVDVVDVAEVAMLLLGFGAPPVLADFQTVNESANLQVGS